jgi:NAD(P)-dependent dehydrogenase (short-subunit alcohol dehydrogenase family)
LSELEGKVALVTGATQGIGEAIAIALARAGATVACSGIEKAESERIAARIKVAGGLADGLVLDVGDRDEIEAVFARLAATGGIDVVVNNAGIFPRSQFVELAELEWDDVLRVNLKGTFLVSQMAARMMRDQGRGGRIVNITSGAAWVPTANSAHYAASKAGIAALTRVMALELAPYGVTVNAVAPGLVDTAQPRSFYSEADLDAIATRIPLGRIGTTDDVAPLVVFLCGEGARYVTGQTMHVNGGLFMP